MVINDFIYIVHVLVRFLSHGENMNMYDCSLTINWTRKTPAYSTLTIKDGILHRAEKKNQVKWNYHLLVI